MLCAPPFVDTSIDVMRAVVYNPGIKENAGVFNHTQGWGVMAECLLGHGDRAYEYYRASMPAAYNAQAEIRQSEPYVQAQTTYSTYSPRAGNTRTRFTEQQRGAISAQRSTSSIRPEPGGLRIDPYPSWGLFGHAPIQGSVLRIVSTTLSAFCASRHVLVDGEPIRGNLVPPGVEGSST
jgi:cellobiose phosphorylase